MPCCFVVLLPTVDYVEHDLLWITGLPLLLSVASVPKVAYCSVEHDLVKILQLPQLPMLPTVAS